MFTRSLPGPGSARCHLDFSIRNVAKKIITNMLWSITEYQKESWVQGESATNPEVGFKPVSASMQFSEITDEPVMNKQTRGKWDKGSGGREEKIHTNRSKAGIWILLEAHSLLLQIWPHGTVYSTELLPEKQLVMLSQNIKLTDCNISLPLCHLCENRVCVVGDGLC